MNLSGREIPRRRHDSREGNQRFVPGRAHRQFLIKVCGITCLEDALASVMGGANALGFNFFAGSSRFIEPAEAAEMIGKIPDTVLCVGILVIESHLEKRGERSFEAISGKVIDAGVDAIQIHGVNCEAEVPDLGIRTFVATSPETACKFPNHEIVIDSSWGSGTVADWNAIMDLLDRPYILSGGLTPGNVEEALRKLRPAGVDVCSGVEASPGRKDPERLESFLSIVRVFCDDFGSDRSDKEK